MVSSPVKLLLVLLALTAMAGCTVALFHSTVIQKETDSHNASGPATNGRGGSTFDINFSPK